MRTKWYHYLLAVAAGVFLINTLPHYLHGISGEPFPTPFADPPGVGLSSPVLNVVWASINAAIALAIIMAGRLARRGAGIWIAMAAGGVAMSFFLAGYFA